MAKKPMDHTSFTTRPIGDSAAQSQVNVSKSTQTNLKHWWQEKDEESIGKAAVEQLEGIETAQQYRHRDLLTYARLYGGRQMAGFGIGQYARIEAAVPAKKSQKPEKLRTTMNICASAIDTVHAKITKNRPKPFFLTKGGTFNQRQKAKKLNRFCDGLFYETKYHELLQRQAMDAEIFGTGVIKAFEQDCRVSFERVMPGELFVDEAEAINGNPRNLFQRKVIAREVALAVYGFEDGKKNDKNIRLILDAEPADSKGLGLYGDMIILVESWHLPSSKTARDGKWAVSVSSGALETCEWTHDYFPFSFLHWGRPVVGFWGQSAIGRIAGIQLEVNKMLKRINEMMHWSVPRVFLPGSAQVAASEISNEIMGIIKYQGMVPPSFSSPSLVPQEYWQAIETWYAKALGELGISELSAQARKPAGLNSSVALNTYNDIETERFAPFAQAYEQAPLTCARIAFDIIRDIATRKDENGKARGYTVTSPAKKLAEEIDWTDVDLAEDAYVMQAFPVSSLPSTPAAKQEMLEQWINMGWVTPEEARRLADFPDLDQSNSLATSALDDIDRTLDDILEGKDYRPPEPFQDLQLCLKRGISAYLRARADDYPAARIDAVANFVLQVQGLIKSMEPEPVAAPMGPPPGMPMDPAAMPMDPGMPPVLQ